MGYRTMKYVRSLLAASLLLLCAPVLAQWQVSQHAVPIGKGGGNIGFNSVLGSNGQVLFGATGSDPVFRAPSFSDLVGSIAVSQMNGGTGANSSTCWHGDGTWQPCPQNGTAAAVQIPRIGTAIGNMTGGGGITIPTNQNTPYWPSTTAAALAATTDAYVGFNFSTPQVIGRVIVYGSTDLGYVAGNFSVTLNLRAKHTSPSGPSDGTLLGSVAGFANTPWGGAQPLTLISNDQTTAWEYAWVEVAPQSSITAYIGQMYFFGPGAAPGGWGQKTVGQDAFNDPLFPALAMQMSVGYATVFIPSTGATLDVPFINNTTSPHGIECLINGPGAGGRDRSVAYAAHETVWWYWIYSTSSGLNCVNSPNPPLIGGPILPSGFIGWAPAFPLTITSDLDVPSSSSGDIYLNSDVRARDNAVFFANSPLVPYTIASVPAGQFTPELDVSLNPTLPWGASSFLLFEDPEISGSGGGSLAGFLLVDATTHGAYTNTSVYTNVAGPAANNAMIRGALDGGLKVGIEWGQIAGTSSSPYTTILFMMGYSFASVSQR
jgi:hypothetical protein